MKSYRIQRGVILCCLMFLMSLGGKNICPEAQAEPLDDQWALPEAEILIDVGHGGIDGGTHEGGVLEKDINLAVAKKLYLLLNAQGISTVMNRTADYALSDDNRWHATRSRHGRDLSQRSQLSQEINLRMLISLHVNWSRNRSAKGPVVLHQSEGRSALLAFFIQNALNNQQGTRTLPRLGKPLYLLRKVEQPAVIVEMGFISHPDDLKMLTNPHGQTHIAEAIATGLRQYLIVTGG